MNCLNCRYLLWDLPEPRCPECGDPFHVSDFVFQPGAVLFHCPECNHPHHGHDEAGLPSAGPLDCLGCGAAIHVDLMSVSPRFEDARGDPVRAGTPWEYRQIVGFLPALLDGIARLATQPGEYFHRSAGMRSRGALLFSVICAYAAAAMAMALAAFVNQSGLFVFDAGDRLLSSPRFWLALAVIVPVAQVGWDYGFGFMIYLVLRLLGQRKGDFDPAVRAVAFGSAVLPALFILPPVGVPWYLGVVSSGIEHYHQTTRAQALLAVILPALLTGHLLLAAALVLNHL